MIEENILELFQNIKLVAFDFDGVFTDNMVYVSQNGSEMVRCSRGDGMGITRLRDTDITAIVISTEINPVVSARTNKLKIRCIQSCDDKKVALMEVMNEMNLTNDQVAFVGNDVNDICCLSFVGLPIAVKDSHIDVLPHAKYITQATGGNGAVREICDLLEKAQI